MSLDSVLEHVAAIDRLIFDPASLAGSPGAASLATVAPQQTGVPAATSPSSFAAALLQASAGYEAGSSTSTADASALTDAYTAAIDTDTQASATQGSTGYDEPIASTSALTDAYTPTDALASTYAPTVDTATTGSSALGGVSGAVGASTVTPSEGVGKEIVAIAESQAGQTEQPPGSNESPAIATYRGATAGAIPGAPWCAYFASWVARQAGEPLGSQGQGLGSVAEIWSWAQSVGRAITNGPGVVPKPGDLIVFGDEHVGIVRDVLPDGEIQTVEGNYENKVALNVRTPTEATGYVEMS